MKKATLHFLLTMSILLPGTLSFAMGTGDPFELSRPDGEVFLKDASDFDCPEIEANIGDKCDDGDDDTEEDVVTDDCECVGKPVKKDFDCPEIEANIGDKCDDGDDDTEEDVVTDDCECVGKPVKKDFDCPEIQANIGDKCDDGDDDTEEDVVTDDCECVGKPVKKDFDCPELEANIGDACDDGDESTENDVITADCTCAGTPIEPGFDCPELEANIGDACDDGDESTENDVITADCTCAGTPIEPGFDCPELEANIGDVCDDGDEDTENDVITADCECAGTPIEPGFDCPELEANIGDACDDGDESTENDVITADCTCAGTPIEPGFDCPELEANIGDVCDDGDESTENDVITADCTCAGTPIEPGFDCPELEANIGDACDDGDESTENDVITTDCTCAGTPMAVIDCEGVPGGSALPGTSCDDGNPFTENDVWGNDCNCAGTPLEGCNDLVLDITLDDFGSETTWQVTSEDGLTIIASGGPYPDGIAGTVVTETVSCLDPLCYRLVVNDAGGNGIDGGGYVLSDGSGKRIIVADGLFGSTSQAIPDFCLPLSNQGIIASFCNRTDLLYKGSTQIYASFQPGASGYQFQMTDPHGTYNRRCFSITQNFKPTNLVTNPVPADLDLNVRVRALVGGVYTAFGRACVIRLNSLPGQVNFRMADAAEPIVGLYPNPSLSEVVYLVIGGLEPVEQRVDIDVYDLHGKRVFAQQVTVAGETFNHVLDLGSDIAVGLYMVNVRIGGKLFTQRMVRQ